MSDSLIRDRLAAGAADGPGPQPGDGPGRHLLGDRLKSLRKRKGWTLHQASRRSGLSIGTISKVENNKVSLGYDSLVKLGHGYGVDLSLLLAAEPAASGADSAFSPRDGGLKHATPFYVQEYPFTDLPNRRMIPIYTRVKVRSPDEFEEMIGHPGEEFLLVLEGTIDFYRVGHEPLRMRAGDSFYFDASVAHGSVSVGRGDALLLSVVTAPPHFAASPDTPSNDTSAPAGDAEDATEGGSRP